MATDAVVKSKSAEPRSAKDRYSLVAIADAELEFDMKAETLATILSHMELANMLTILPSSNIDG